MSLSGAGRTFARAVAIAVGLLALAFVSGGIASFELANDPCGYGASEVRTWWPPGGVSCRMTHARNPARTVDLVPWQDVALVLAGQLGLLLSFLRARHGAPPWLQAAAVGAATIAVAGAFRLLVIEFVPAIFFTLVLGVPIVMLAGLAWKRSRDDQPTISLFAVAPLGWVAALAFATVSLFEEGAAAWFVAVGATAALGVASVPLGLAGGRPEALDDDPAAPSPRWLWRVACAMPLVAIAAAVVMGALTEPCGFEGAPACTGGWAASAEELALVVAYVTGIPVAGALAIRLATGRRRS